MARDVPPARRKIRLNQISPLRGSRLRRVPLVVRTLRLRLRSVSHESRLRRLRQGPPRENMHANPAFSWTSRRSGDIPSAADLTNGLAGNTGAQAWISDGRVPEPATLGLTGAGLLTLLAMGKLRRRD